MCSFLPCSWYNVNMSVAQPWKWGKDMGCDFVLKSCFEYMQLKNAANQPIDPWCDLPYDGKTECIPYDNAYGRCELKRLSESLPDEFQHFREIDGIPAKELPYFGGDDLLCDYCPTIDASKVKRKWSNLDRVLFALTTTLWYPGGTLDAAEEGHYMDAELHVSDTSVQTSPVCSCTLE
ncbi:unnamed protein product [Dicrocoelium dendriticum]|nr:unnamed protein product [Dicrocoelium dendriticum]